MALLENKFSREVQSKIWELRTNAGSRGVGWLTRGRAEDLEKRRAQSGIRTEILAERMQQRIIAAREMALNMTSAGLCRSQISNARPGLYQFLLRNDRKWFEAHVPRIIRVLKPREATRVRYRSILVKMRNKDPGFKMRDLPSGVSDWLRKNDRDWLKTQCPSGKYKDLSERIAQLREIAMISLDKGELSPTGIPISFVKTWWSWMMSYDRQWIENVYNKLRRQANLRPKLTS
ncbi:hypothetical protein [Variovorax sp. HW608]|uniref:hypothetical protein n=1 Tax=Variovorax sp. HW608 TaxID=1034889 RepID=UPI001E61C36B|nr:hypothetical protein [Variovorax sp. HW608]